MDNGQKRNIRRYDGTLNLTAWLICTVKFVIFVARLGSHGVIFFIMKFLIHKKKENFSQITEFEKYLQTLSEVELNMIQSFFAEFDSHNSLPRGEKLKMRRDFENALLYYNSSDVPLEEALSRLSIEKLGGFYVRPPILWYALDNAAKIYPLSMTHGQMSVFVKAIANASILLILIDVLLSTGWAIGVVSIVCFSGLVVAGILFSTDIGKQRQNMMPMLMLIIVSLLASISGLIIWKGETRWELVVMGVLALTLLIAGISVLGNGFILEIKKRFHTE